MSFPTNAEVSVNWVPASCMPSPLSPAKRTVTALRVVSRFFPPPCPFPFPVVGWVGCPGTADSVVRLISPCGRRLQPLPCPSASAPPLCVVRTNAAASRPRIHLARAIGVLPRADRAKSSNFSPCSHRQQRDGDLIGRGKTKRILD